MQFLRKRSFVIFITVSILAVLVGGYWYFYGYRPQQLLKSFQNEYKKGVDAQQAGDLNASIAAFNESLKNAPSDLAEVRRKINIASLEFRRNEGDDRVDAVKTYREILENSSLPASYRASAISRLMNFLDASRDEEFAKKEIFKGELLEPFLKEGDVWLAERRAYELSSQLSPSPTTAFLIAGWYNRQLLENKSLTQTAKTEYLAKLKEWTRKGESLLPLMASQNYSKSQAAFAYMLAGIEKGGIAQFFDRNYSPSEYAFKEALKFLGDVSNDADSYNLGFFVRFNYAAMLAEAFGGKRLTDIRVLLQPVIAPPPPQFQNYPFSFYEFLENENSPAHKDYIARKRIVLLSGLMPEFKSFLDSRGLKYE